MGSRWGGKTNTKFNQLANLKGKAPPPLPPHDYDLDMQLEDVVPKHGGSSLQLLTSHEKYATSLNKTAMSTTRLNAINLAEMTQPTTSHKSPRKGNTTNTQNTKKRKSEACDQLWYNQTTKHTKQRGNSDHWHSITNVTKFSNPWSCCIMKGQKVSASSSYQRRFRKDQDPLKENLWL